VSSSDSPSRASELGEKAAERGRLKHGQQERPPKGFVAAARPAVLLVSWKLAEQMGERLVLGDDALVLVRLVGDGRLFEERGPHVRVGDYLAAIDPFDDPAAGVGVGAGACHRRVGGADGLARAREPAGSNRLEALTQKRRVARLDT
jgi:hypothetical protein